MSRQRIGPVCYYLSFAHTKTISDQAHQDLALLASPSVAWLHETELNWDLDIDPFARSALEDQISTPDLGLSFIGNPDDYNTEVLPDAPGDSYDLNETATMKFPSTKNFAAGAALDLKPGHSTTFIGYSNESDPFALDQFPYDDQDEIDFFRVTYRKFTPKGLDRGCSSTHPIHFLQSQTGTAVEARRVIDECLPKLDFRAELEAIVDRTAGVALVKL